MQQGPQGLSRGCCLTDLYSDDPILHVVLSFSRLDIECAHFCSAAGLIVFTFLQRGLTIRMFAESSMVALCLAP